MRTTVTMELLDAAITSTAYVNSVWHGDPYEKWNNRSVKYVSVCYDLQQLEVLDTTKRYQVLIYVADRMEQDGSNVTAAWDACEAVLDATVASLQHTDGILECTRSVYYPYKQKFADMLAGYYTTLIIEVPRDINYCDNEVLD